MSADERMVEQDVINQREWERPENWKGLLRTYRSGLDTRVWVPKQNPALGWTLNFARRESWWALLAMCTVPVGLILLLVLISTLARH